ncbi:Histidine ABC transporter, permease protein HisM (TC 3.A.1.3.1) [Caballeronia glathei]|jgi:histidine transport system permease protein|uniref:Histidine/lysine/arginine/ornithine transport system permease protein HisM n=1 Tax=Caballeronia glathei TaxID=60547 RepID=A0A069PVU8_9BURK|nr:MULTISPECIES: ABC transporter permease [Burkholderiaceae]KDR44547.1 amino acid ABC transporter permease [Caballeronia glathei]TCK44339.1 amino acid ABC transporter membrane protein 2 (PAAT family) [Paraburkholderia sp. BL8N3]CDY73969.1 Histidine ABC transporter, permease protein HisM (TC 3.A.1.3.1) [Caballeronia glathei]
MLEIIQEYWKNYLFTDGYRITGLAITMWLLVVSIALGFCLSVPLAVARVSKNKILSRGVWLYTYIFRGTPLYVQLLLCYTGLYSLQVVRDHMLLNEFFRNGMNCTLLAFTLNTCAYTTEIFAGAIKATPYGEIEAARAYGMSGFTLYRRVILPSALRRALPYYSNEVILMLHATTVAFTATVPDILKIARDVNSATYRSFEAFGIAALLYLVISFALVWLFRRAEHRWLAYLRPQGK